MNYTKLRKEQRELIADNLELRIKLYEKGLTIEEEQRLEQNRARLDDINEQMKTYLDKMDKAFKNNLSMPIDAGRKVLDKVDKLIDKYGGKDD